MIDFEKYLDESLKEGANGNPGMIRVSPINVLRGQVTDPARTRAMATGADDIIRKQRKKLAKETKARLDKAGFNVLKFGEVRLGITWQPSIGIEVVNHPRSIRLSAALPCSFPIIAPSHLDQIIAVGACNYISDLSDSSRFKVRHHDRVRGHCGGFTVNSNDINCVFYYEKSSGKLPDSHSYLSIQLNPWTRITERELPIVGKLNKYAEAREIEEAQQPMFELMFNFVHNLSLLESTRCALDRIIADLKIVDEALVDTMTSEEFTI